MLYFETACLVSANLTQYLKHPWDIHDFQNMNANHCYQVNTEFKTHFTLPSTYRCEVAQVHLVFEKIYGYLQGVYTCVSILTNEYMRFASLENVHILFLLSCHNKLVQLLQECPGNFLMTKNQPRFSCHHGVFCLPMIDYLKNRTEMILK